MYNEYKEQKQDDANFIKRRLKEERWAIERRNDEIM